MNTTNTTSNATSTNLDNLSVKEFIKLFDNCASDDEQLVSDACFKKYGVRLCDSDAKSFSMMSFAFGIIVTVLAYYVTQAYLFTQ